jgi:hypothetical protein
MQCVSAVYSYRLYRVVGWLCVSGTDRRGSNPFRLFNFIRLNSENIAIWSWFFQFYSIDFRKQNELELVLVLAIRGWKVSRPPRQFLIFTFRFLIQFFSKKVFVQRSWKSLNRHIASTSSSSSSFFGMRMSIKLLWFIHHRPYMLDQAHAEKWVDRKWKVGDVKRGMQGKVISMSVLMMAWSKLIICIIQWSNWKNQKARVMFHLTLGGSLAYVVKTTAEK